MKFSFNQGFLTDLVQWLSSFKCWSCFEKCKAFCKCRVVILLLLLRLLKSVTQKKGPVFQHYSASLQQSILLCEDTKCFQWEFIISPTNATERLWKLKFLSNNSTTCSFWVTIKNVQTELYFLVTCQFIHNVVSSKLHFHILSLRNKNSDCFRTCYW